MRPVVDATVAAPDEPPGYLLYLLPAGQDKEVVLEVHGTVPTDHDLATWLSTRAAVTLTASREGSAGTFPVTVNFAHIVLARTAPHTITRHVTF
ncbi:hypothetical protein OHV05_36080 (plasmid) [Kitasatospora sp. NBC_00070]|uniref:hypothetical protein n=1 Tax=Kitasatospora sp. NBC_00070 TaxID=2975962 RepID=UPI003251860C